MPFFCQINHATATMPTNCWVSTMPPRRCLGTFIRVENHRLIALGLVFGYLIFGY